MFTDSLRVITTIKLPNKHKTVTSGSNVTFITLTPAVSKSYASVLQLFLEDFLRYNPNSKDCGTACNSCNLRYGILTTCPGVMDVTSEPDVIDHMNNKT